MTRRRKGRRRRKRNRKKSWLMCMDYRQWGRRCEAEEEGEEEEEEESEEVMADMHAQSAVGTPV